MQPSTPRLSELARHLVVPEGIVTTAWPRVERRLERVGVEFDPWQQGFATLALGKRTDGTYAASIGGVVASIPRQVGKTFSVGYLLVGMCLEYPGLRVIWTSHHNRTTTNTFRSMQGMVRGRNVFPHLAPNGIRTANGEQEIRFRNGSIIMFGAREQGFGRGMDKIDVLVFDEAQILTIKALEDMVPATNQAKHSAGALVFFIGTPPRPTDPGEAFAAKRARAIEGESTDQVYLEFSADPDASPDDRSQWPIMNPSFPHRTPSESMLRMRENIPDDEAWRREAMGVWPSVSKHIAVVKPSDWDWLESKGPDASVAPDALGVDMSHGGDLSIGACWVRGESVHIEEVWSGGSVTAAADFLGEVAGRRIEVVIDDISPAAQMVPDLKARRVRVRRSSARDMAKACGQFESRVHQGVEAQDGEVKALTHGGQAPLTDALMGARKRPIGDAGGWGWDRRDSTVAIYPLVAATLALLSAVENRRARRAAVEQGEKRRVRRAVIG